jgi:hypothetical protein
MQGGKVHIGPSAGMLGVPYSSGCSEASLGTPIGRASLIRSGDSTYSRGGQLSCGDTNSRCVLGPEGLKGLVGKGGLPWPTNRCSYG